MTARQVLRVALPEFLHFLFISAALLEQEAQDIAHLGRGPMPIPFLIRGRGGCVTDMTAKRGRRYRAILPHGWVKGGQEHINRTADTHPLLCRSEMGQPPTVVLTGTRQRGFCDVPVLRLDGFIKGVGADGADPSQSQGYYGRRHPAQVLDQLALRLGSERLAGPVTPALMPPSGAAVSANKYDGIKCEEAYNHGEEPEKTAEKYGQLFQILGETGEAIQGREDTGGGMFQGREDTGGEAIQGREDTGGGMFQGREDTGGEAIQGREDTGGGMFQGREDTGGEAIQGREDAGGEILHARRGKRTLHRSLVVKIAVSCSEKV